MSTPSIRVLTPENVAGIGQQNKVVRRLRALGCKVLATSLDGTRTIVVEPGSVDGLRQHPGGRLTRRTETGNVVSIDIDGCKVVWTEGRTS